MHDYVSEVDEDPGTIGIAFDARDAVTVPLRGFDDRVGDRARLNLRASGDDRERVGQNRAGADVERRKGLAFFIERALAYEVD